MSCIKIPKKAQILNDAKIIIHTIIRCFITTYSYKNLAQLDFQHLSLHQPGFLEKITETEISLMTSHNNILSLILIINLCCFRLKFTMKLLNAIPNKILCLLHGSPMSFIST